MESSLGVSFKVAWKEVFRWITLSDRPPICEFFGVDRNREQRTDVGRKEQDGLL